MADHAILIAFGAWHADPRRGADAMSGPIRRGLILGLALTICGCSQDADRLARVFQKTAAKFDGVTEGLRDKLNNGWGAVRSSVSETSLDSRVALRLRWDTDMAGADVEVHLVGPGAVELTGAVADLTQRRRAIELAHTTAGVESVVDRLRVEADASKE
jgi:osmotically-inducible protein OsmY